MLICAIASKHFRFTEVLLCTLLTFYLASPNANILHNCGTLVKSKHLLYFRCPCGGKLCEPQAGEAECEHKHTHMHIYAHIHLSYIHAHNRDILTKYTCTLAIHTNTTYAYKAHIQIHITYRHTKHTCTHTYNIQRDIQVHVPYIQIHTHAV